MKSPKSPRPRQKTVAVPERRPTINDIARLAKVSKKTVSRVINRSPSVSGDTRSRVEKVIEELGFAPDPQARGLAFRHSFLIGLIYDNPNPQYVVNMQSGLLDGMRGSGFELVVHPCDRSSPSFLADLKGFIQRQKLYGVVLTPSASEDERAGALLAELGCKYIRVASVELDDPEHMLVTNDRLGGRAAAIHLADLGHTRFAFISGPTTFRSSHERRMGFETALAERGIKLLQRNIFEGTYRFASGVSVGEKLFAMKARPTAIFAANDEMAAGVLHAARQAGLNAPADFSLVGFDDFEIATSVWPPLTTVHTPTRELGRIAAEKLIGLEPKDRPDAAPRLIIRKSSGPPPG